MARNRTTSFNFQEIFEEHPIKSCIACFLIGVSVTYAVMTFLYDNKIESIKNRYEDKIELLNRSHAQDLEIKEIKLNKEEGTKYYLNIDPKSKLAKDLTNLVERSSNEK